MYVCQWGILWNRQVVSNIKSCNLELLFLHYNNCNNCGYSVTIQSMMLRLYNIDFNFFVVLKVLFFSCLTVANEQAGYGTEGVWYVIKC